MHPSSEFPSADNPISAAISSYGQEDSSRNKASQRKGQGKSRRKHDVGGQHGDEEKVAKASSRDVDIPPPPSPPQQLPASPDLYPFNGSSSVLFNALDEAPTANDIGLGRDAWANGNTFVDDSHRPRNEVSVAESPSYATRSYSDDLRGGFKNTSPPSSPPSAYRLPARRNNAYQSFGDYLGSSPGRSRPVSMPVTFAQDPPPPHHPQPHFYGVRDTDLGVFRSRSTSRKLSPSDLCTFDTLALNDVSAPLQDVLLVAIDNGLVVYRVEKESLRPLGRLEHLPGAVLEAKVLPCSSRTNSLQTLRPLVAVTMYGPFTEVCEPQHHQLATSNVRNPVPERSRKTQDASHFPNTTGTHSPSQYQTSVEIYSLRDGSHVTTLFKTAPVSPEQHYNDPIFENPRPTANLTLQAEGRFVTITSGISGEVYIFEAVTHNLEQHPEGFRCLGKVWTSMPLYKGRSLSTSSASSDAESNSDGSPSRLRPLAAPILSLSHRWLAIAPPVSSYQSTIHGRVGLQLSSQKAPGLSSHTAPIQPQPTCFLDTPPGDTLFGKFTRGATQEFIKGATWVGNQSFQVWKSYWNRSPDTGPSSHDHGQHPSMTPYAQQSFPPTHAHDDTNRFNHQPTTISILDLDRLSGNQTAKPSDALKPTATFALPGGCQFVSFNPSGLSLLTVNTKGDVQTVWDLMRIASGKPDISLSKEAAAPEKGPSVRQIAQFRRITPAKIIDVVWTSPRGERLALVSDRGTVHVYDLPSSAFRWPPPRRIARPATAPSQSDYETTPGPLASTFSPIGLTAAMNMVGGRAQPLLAAVRGRPPKIANAIAGLGGFGFKGNATAKGGRTIATGISKSMEVATGTIDTVRHMGENRLHIPGQGQSHQPVTRGCAKWLCGNVKSLIAVVGAGVVCTHDVRESTHTQAGKRRPSVIGERPVKLPLPDLNTLPSHLPLMTTPPNTLQQNTTSQRHPNNWLSPGVTLDPRQYQQQPPLPASFARRKIISPLSNAELETTAPYQPFHTDRRINLCVYIPKKPTLDIDPLHSGSNWCFGEDIETIRVSSGASSDSLDEQVGAGMENLISFEGQVEEEMQVVVTTRRKRGGKGRIVGEVEEEDIFEEEADWVDFVGEGGRV